MRGRKCQSTDLVPDSGENWSDHAHETEFWGPFLESPGSLAGPKSNIQIKI